MKGELITESLKLEGELFLIGKKIDKETDLNKFIKLQKELHEKRVKFDQYNMILNELNKQESIKKAKRKILRRWA